MKVFKYLIGVALVLGALQATPQGQVVITRSAAFITNYVTNGTLAMPADGVITLANAAGTDFTRLQFGGTTSSFPAISRSTTALSVVLADNSAAADLLSANLLPSAVAVTAGAGTGITVSQTGKVTELTYIVTIDRTAFVCAAVTCDVTIATLPAKTVLRRVLADLTTTFACTATCTTSTLSAVLGRGAGGAEFLASFDADASASQFGDADAELGTQMTRAAAIQGGALGAWASTTTVVIRMTSGTGNIGTGSATNFSQGSITFYIGTERLI